MPIGAVAVLDGAVVGRGFNRPISAIDPTAHAEIVAMREAASAIGNYRLAGIDLYVTLEPCLMCVGALVHARVTSVIFGAREPRTGALVSSTRALEIPSLNHRFEIVEGVLEEECRESCRLSSGSALTVLRPTSSFFAFPSRPSSASRRFGFGPFVRPLRDRVDGGRQRAPFPRQRVFHANRRLGNDRAFDNTLGSSS